MELAVLLCQSSLRRADVPCKLNNTKTNYKHLGQFINGLFKISMYIELTANENS